MKTRARVARITVLAALLTAPFASMPSGATAGGDPSVERIRPGSLERGPSTPLLHLVGRTIRDGATTVKVTGSPTVTLVGRVGPDYLVVTSDSDHQEPYAPGWQLRRVKGSGEQRVLLRRPGSDPPRALLAEGGAHVVLVSYRDDDVVVRVIDTATGDRDAKRVFPHGQVLDVARRRMVVTQWWDRSDEGRTFWWNPMNDRTPRIADQSGYIADVSADRLGLITSEAVKGGCQKVVRLSRPSQVLWRSCDDAAFAFSPTGERMVTVPIYSDGPFTPLIKIRAAGGRVLDRYRAEYFGTVHWESDRRLLLGVAGSQSAAMVRCTLRACERISPLSKLGDRDPQEAAPAWQFADESLHDR